MRDMKIFPSAPAAIVTGLFVPTVFRTLDRLKALGSSDFVIFLLLAFGLFLPVALAVIDWKEVWEQRQPMFSYYRFPPWEKAFELVLPVWGRMLLVGLSAALSAFFQFGLRP